MVCEEYLARVCVCFLSTHMGTRALPWSEDIEC